MFSIPQPTTGKTSEETTSTPASTQNEITIIPISDNASLLISALALSYPCVDAITSTKEIEARPFAELVQLIRVSQKYFLDFSTSRLVDALVLRVVDHPDLGAKTYAVGCVLGLNKLVEAGKNGCLKCSLQTVMLLDVDSKKANRSNDMEEGDAKSDEVSKAFASKLSTTDDRADLADDPYGEVFDRLDRHSSYERLSTPPQILQRQNGSSPQDHLCRLQGRISSRYREPYRLLYR